MVERSPITEDTRQAPVSPYGETKLMGERMLHWFGGLGLRYVALRYFNASGADPEGQLGERHEPETHLIPNTIRAALGTGSKLNVFGTDYETADGTAIRDYVHVTDLADAHVRSVHYLVDGGVNLAANLGSGTGHSVLSVITEVERLTGRPVPRVLGPRRPGDAVSLFAAAERAKKTLGWQTRFSDLETICRTAVAWENRAGRR
jgi:UDP-glucose-4-epimerase GalE